MSYPIILAHGVCRFDMVLNDVLSIDNSDDPKLDQLHYFKGLRTELMHRGYAVYHSCVSWAADVDTRAGELKDNILESWKKNALKKSTSSPTAWAAWMRVTCFSTIAMRTASTSGSPP